jgi:hypothetical protein
VLKSNSWHRQLSVDIAELVAYRAASLSQHFHRRPQLIAYSPLEDIDTAVAMLADSILIAVYSQVLTTDWGGSDLPDQRQLET